jgi:hypothetical protein
MARLGANSLTSLSAQSHYKLHFNMLDWEMGREFFAGKSLTLRPFFGVRSAWIKQKYEVDYNNVYVTSPVCSKFTTNITNNFWGLGPRVGLNGEWQLGSGLSLYGNAALSALYGFFHLYQSEHVDNPIDDPDQGPLFPTADAAGQVTGINNSFHAVKVATDLQIGLRWDYMFCHDACHIGLHAGWQQELFFSQNQIMNFPNLYEIGQFYQNQGDLGFQGWTVGARFDF